MAEVVEELGISRQGFAGLRQTKSAGFPPPIAELKATPVWDLDEIAAWQRHRPLRGPRQHAVLTMFALNERPWLCGYEIGRELGHLGSIYAVLGRLERRGWLESNWEGRRHYYRLTHLGLKEWRRSDSNRRPSLCDSVARPN